MAIGACHSTWQPSPFSGRNRPLVLDLTFFLPILIRSSSPPLPGYQATTSLLLASRLEWICLSMRFARSPFGAQLARVHSHNLTIGLIHPLAVNFSPGYGDRQPYHGRSTFVVCFSLAASSESEETLGQPIIIYTIVALRGLGNDQTAATFRTSTITIFTLNHFILRLRSRLMQQLAWRLSFTHSAMRSCSSRRPTR